MGRINKAVKTIIKSGIDPFLDGKKNFENQSEEMEALARKRLQTCLECVHFKDEPIEVFKVNDENLPEASGKYCEDCGCVLSFKLRQSIEPCAKWQEEK